MKSQALIQPGNKGYSNGLMAGIEQLDCPLANELELFQLSPLSQSENIREIVPNRLCFMYLIPANKLGGKYLTKELSGIF